MLKCGYCILMVMVLSGVSGNALEVGAGCFPGHAIVQLANGK